LTHPTAGTLPSPAVFDSVITAGARPLRSLRSDLLKAQDVYKGKQ